jgi:hypothetical protein
MPRACTICQHPERAEIDKALASGESYRGISRTYFGSAKAEDALSRHKAEHLPATVAKAAAVQQVDDARGAVDAGLDVVSQLRAINGVTLAVLKEARERHDGELALKAVDRVQRQIELQAKLLGDLDERPQVNILVAPEWIELRTVLLKALQSHPEARQAVAAVLIGVERGSG